MCRAFYQKAGSGSQTAPFLNQAPGEQIKHRNKQAQYPEGSGQRDITDTEETITEAADHIDNRVQFRHRLPERR